MIAFQSVVVSSSSSSSEEEGREESARSSSARCRLVVLLSSALLSTRFRNARSLLAIQLFRAIAFVGPSLFRTTKPLHAFCIFNAAFTTTSFRASCILIFRYLGARQHGHRRPIDSRKLSKLLKHCSWKQCAHDVSTCARSIASSPNSSLHIAHVERAPVLSFASLLIAFHEVAPRGKPPGEEEEEEEKEEEEERNDADERTNASKPFSSLSSSSSVSSFLLPRVVLGAPAFTSSFRRNDIIRAVSGSARVFLGFDLSRIFTTYRNPKHKKCAIGTQTPSSYRISKEEKKKTTSKPRAADTPTIKVSVRPPPCAHRI